MRRLLTMVAIVAFALVLLALIPLSSRTVRHLFRPAKPTSTPDAALCISGPAIQVGRDVPPGMLAKAQDLFRATHLDGTVDVYITGADVTIICGGVVQESAYVGFRFTIHVPNLNDQRYLASLVRRLAPIPQQATLLSTSDTNYVGLVTTIFTTGDTSCRWDSSYDSQCVAQ